MAISPVVTRGYGSFGTVNLVVTRGYGAGAAVPSAAIQTSTSPVFEADVVSGDLDVFITLSNDTWVPAGGQFDAQKQAIINGLNSAQSEATGWNALVRDVIGVITVVRTADDTVVVNIPATPGYVLTAPETITVTVPADALVTSTVDVVGAPTFEILLDTTPPPTVAEITGTATTGITEAEIQAGGNTIVITLTNDTWASTGFGVFDGVRQDILDGIASTSGIFLANEVVTAVVRTSDTVVTIILTADPPYDIAVTDTVTVEVPSSALITSLVDVTATPTFDITTDTPPPPPIPDAVGGGKGDNRRARGKYSARPLGLTAKRKVEERIEEARQIHAEVSQAAKEQFVVPERPAEISLAPVSEMLPAEIDAEIAYWFKVKQRLDNDLILILLIAGSIH